MAVLKIKVVMSKVVFNGLPTGDLPATTTTIFEFISRGPTPILGCPLMLHQLPLLQCLRQIWRVAGRESGSPELLGSPPTSPEVPPKFFGDFPGSSLTVELSSNPGVPRKFPGLPRKSPKLPRKFPDFPGGQPLSLGSLTPSPDSQKLCLIHTGIGNQPAPYRGLSGPPGPKSQKSLKNVSRGLRPRDPKKSQKSLGDSPGSPRRVSGKCLESVFGLSPGLFGDFLGSRGRRPRETFLRLFWDLGPGGPERPL